MAGEPIKQDKACLAMWMVVIEFGLAAFRDELQMDKLLTEDINVQLARLDPVMAALRQHLEMTE